MLECRRDSELTNGIVWYYWTETVADCSRLPKSGLALACLRGLRGEWAVDVVLDETVSHAWRKLVALLWLGLCTQSETGEWQQA